MGAGTINANQYHRTHMEQPPSAQLAAAPWLAIERVDLGYGGRLVVQGLSLSLQRGSVA